MLKIELRNEAGEIKTYTQDFVSGRKFRTAMKFGQKVEKGELSELEVVDEMVALVASMFDSEAVSFDSIYDGVSASDLLNVLNSVLEGVTGGVMGQVDMVEGK
ncbi:hypothetical protein A374_08719 [Fictibacillus macauensis ZFHKF-1]|uniref:Phage protein n=1 Tax=Fictibacillus macauensis ZFHKF-1 TaxID=1196324 RepID=I8UG76_9BACL|nr:hypothetical protein [Fictibacillus macauensis]EIT85905.1 hypothetical protein A374_08719 [Fictibacillus macauensis ZFHKF-1]